MTKLFYKFFYKVKEPKTGKKLFDEEEPYDIFFMIFGILIIPMELVTKNCKKKQTVNNIRTKDFYIFGKYETKKK